MLNDPNTEFLPSLDAALPGVVHDTPPAYLEEQRKMMSGQAAALLKPRSTEDVAEIARRANAAKVGLIPYSGGTGLVGGQVRPDADPPAVIVSLERMDRIRAVDALDRTVVAEAGAILADVQGVAEGAELLFPLSLASEGSCRIGGNMATNAGGLNVIRYGNTRDLVLGIEAVLADGTVIHGLKALKKDNTGYDLRHLLIGAEGTLGIITAARLKLVDRPDTRVTALLQLPGPVEAVGLLRQMQEKFAELVTAFELVDRMGVSFIEETMPDHVLPPLGEARWFALVELAGNAEAQLAERFETALSDAMEAGLVTDGFIAQSEAQRQVIWSMRETMPEANRKVGAIVSHDISVPIARIPEFLDRARAAVSGFDADIRINSFGHVGDGNLHYNLFPPKGQLRASYANLKAPLQRAVHDLVAEFDGSISAEHGIGRFKKEDLARYGDPGKLAAMRAIKSALDPNGIMNPGAVIDLA